MTSPQWITASAPASLAAWTALANIEARSWLSETIQIFITSIYRNLLEIEMFAHFMVGLFVKEIWHKTLVFP